MNISRLVLSVGSVSALLRVSQSEELSMKVQRSDNIDIDVSADEVSQIIGEGFTEIGEWVRSVASSRPIEGPVLPGAPAVRRVRVMSALVSDSSEWRSTSR